MSTVGEIVNSVVEAIVPSTPESVKGEIAKKPPASVPHTHYLAVSFIPHREQRYETVGDYVECSKDTTEFTISKMRPLKYCWLVALHEIIEWTICHINKIPGKAIDKFDMAYEQARKRGDQKAPCGCGFTDEPGFDRHAPYVDAHRAATQCEKIIAKALGIEWGPYGDAVEKL
jgi:hypothetical protein